MLGVLLGSTVPLAAAAGASAARPAYVYVVAAMLLLLIVVSAALLVWWWRKRQRVDDATAYVNPMQSIPSQRLLSIWEKFSSRLPSGVRLPLPEYAHFVVLGNSGAGKSALIGRKIDWQGQASQFIPSFTADPLMQVYLGSSTVAQEFSAVVQDATGRSYNAALSKLWRGMEIDQAPTVLIVLMAPLLASATPDQVRQQAQLLRGKINVLAAATGSSPRVRLCLTHMDRVRGYSDLARFLHKNHLPLELEVGAEPSSDLPAALLAYERYLPRALTTLPVTTFESVVDFLRGTELLLAPVISLVQALSEGSAASQRPELQRVYFSSLSADEQVGNPFDPPPHLRTAPLGSFLSRWLRSFGVRPVHALLGLGLIGLGLGSLALITKRHHALVARAAAAGVGFDASVERARKTQSSGESDVVRRAELQASEALLATQTAEDHWRLLRLIYRPDKRENEQRFVDSIRRGYLLPSLERAIRQRDRSKILSSLVALYATAGNTLGALILAQPTDWSTDLTVPRDTLLRYIHHSKEPWTEVALIALPPLPLDSARVSVSELAPWRAFLSSVAQAIKKPFVTYAELRQLQQQGADLREALTQIRRASLWRQLYRNLAEESPLDMAKLFGRDASALTPSSWVTDHQSALERVLQLVQESSIQTEQAGTKSLYQLLLWLNDSGSPPSTAQPRSDEELWRFLLPNDSASYDISRPDWLALLARSRTRAFSFADIATESRSNTSAQGTRRSKACSKKGRKQRRTAQCNANELASMQTTQSAWGQGDRARPVVRRTLAPGLPLWSEEEFAPKLAALLTSSEAPAIGLSEVYNRAVFHREVLPLVHELKKALSGNRRLSAEEKISLSRAVQAELARYARHYCNSLLEYHLGYRVEGRSQAALHAELLDLIKPGSPFLARLRVVVESTELRGLDEPYLRPLATCLSDFRPLVVLLTPAASAASRLAEPRSDKVVSADTKAAGAGPAPTQIGPPAASDSAASTAAGAAKGDGLAAYNEAVAKLVAALDRVQEPASATSAVKDRAAELMSRLSPLGRAALAMHEGGEDSALRKAEQFLDQAGVIGALRRPFLAPFLAVYQAGTNQIEHVLATHWRETVSAQLEQLLSRYPFQRAAEREVAPADLDLINERKGAFFTTLRGLYAPVLVEQDGAWRQRSGALGPVKLPADLLPTVNRMLKLSRALFTPEGARHPLEVAIRGLPGSQVQGVGAAQPALAFLQVGKAAAYGFNQQSSALPLSIDWWAQGAAIVGVESVAVKTGRKHTQTLEVSDSAWSLFRLLQRSTLDSAGVSTWRILSDSTEESQAIRFVITPDPWELFGASSR